MITATNSTEVHETIIVEAQQNTAQIERHGKTVAVVLSVEELNLLRDAVADKGEEYQKAFSEAAALVFTESDNALRLLANL
jgi:hypothetical protein